MLQQLMLDPSVSQMLGLHWFPSWATASLRTVSKSPILEMILTDPSLTMGNDGHPPILTSNKPLCTDRRMVLSLKTSSQRYDEPRRFEFQEIAATSTFAFSYSTATLQPLYSHSTATLQLLGALAINEGRPFRQL